MKCIVISTGNAGRPVARIPNHIGNTVCITDKKAPNEFPERVQKTLKILANERIKLLQGINSSHTLENFNYVGLSAITNYNDIKDKMIVGIKEGCKKND